MNLPGEVVEFLQIIEGRDRPGEHSLEIVESGLGQSFSCVNAENLDCIMSKGMYSVLLIE